MLTYPIHDPLAVSDLVCAPAQSPVIPTERQSEILLARCIRKSERRERTGSLHPGGDAPSDSKYEVVFTCIPYDIDWNGKHVHRYPQAENTRKRRLPCASALLCLLCSRLFSLSWLLTIAQAIGSRLSPHPADPPVKALQAKSQIKVFIPSWHTYLP